MFGCPSKLNFVTNAKKEILEQQGLLIFVFLSLNQTIFSAYITFRRKYFH